MKNKQAPSKNDTQFDLRIERLGPLPIINHFIERIGLEQAFDQHVPSDSRCTVSHARTLGALLRSIIVEREPIYRQHETVHGFADGMFGLSATEMAHLSDDRLGRALDHLFDADRGALITEVCWPSGAASTSNSMSFTTTARRSVSAGTIAGRPAERSGDGWRRPSRTATPRRIAPT
jgi:hypothetical protein